MCIDNTSDEPALCRRVWHTIREEQATEMSGHFHDPTQHQQSLLNESKILVLKSISPTFSLIHLPSTKNHRTTKSLHNGLKKRAIQQKPQNTTLEKAESPFHSKKQNNRKKSN